MSVKIVRACDKCKSNVEEKQQLWKVGVEARCYNGFAAPSLTNYDFVKGMGMDVCRSCLEGFGIHAQSKDISPTSEKPPTLEELILEIVAEGLEQSS